MHNGLSKPESLGGHMGFEHLTTPEAREMFKLIWQALTAPIINQIKHLIKH